MSYYVANPKLKDDIIICEPFTRGACQEQCPYLHHQKNYLWQIHVENLGWLSIKESDDIEQAYVNPNNIHHVVQSELIGGDGATVVLAQILLNFTSLSAEVSSADGQLVNVLTTTRRLSTKSYMLSPVEKVGLYDTPWIWYWQDGQQWKKFGEDSAAPAQYVLEAKYLGGQEVFRFEVDVPGAGNPLVFLLNLNLQHLKCVNNNNHWTVTRRPGPGVGGALLDRKPLPYPIEFPDNWTPIDSQHDFELVPLNPQSMEYHLVASEFVSSIPQGRTILDVFRLQNPFLWFKYYSKKLFMESKGKSPNELQLFHGTSDELAVQSIFRQNFDWRMCGKNATLYGKGAYFASQARLSDRYTGPQSRMCQKRWMFMARVMVGRYCEGNRDLVRPPPLDPSKPHGEMYDSCVDTLVKPTMHIVFDTDQCYPEYALCYELTPQQWLGFNQTSAGPSSTNF